MKIGELAKCGNTTKDTIRHYVALGLLESDKDPDNGYQMFNHQAVTRLKFIQTAKQLGLTLEDIRFILDDAANDRLPCARVRELITRHIQETRQKIKELSVLCSRMESNLALWEAMPDEPSNEYTICPLIESTSINSKI